MKSNIHIFLHFIMDNFHSYYAKSCFVKKYDIPYVAYNILLICKDVAKIILYEDIIHVMR